MKTPFYDRYSPLSRTPSGSRRWSTPSITVDPKVLTWRYNIFIERLLRSIKYEEVCLKADEKVFEAWVGIGQYLTPTSIP